jgi:hypothetical protein
MDRFFQKIEVSVHKEIAGQWQPDRFLWQGRMYTILESGRRWQDLDGEHILVMILGGQVFELILATDQISWYLKPPTVARMA